MFLLREGAQCAPLHKSGRIRECPVPLFFRTDKKQCPKRLDSPGRGSGTYLGLVGRVLTRQRCATEVAPTFSHLTPLSPTTPDAFRTRSYFNSSKDISDSLKALFIAPYIFYCEYCPLAVWVLPFSPCQKEYGYGKIYFNNYYMGGVHTFTNCLGILLKKVY